MPQVLNELAKGFSMSPARLVIGASWICALIGLQAWQTLAKRDDWPLSSYPMYSGAQPGHISRGELLAVSPAGEVSLTAEQVDPMTPRTVGMVLRHASPKHQTAIRRAIIDHYYARKAAGAHDGPQLSSLRRYQHTWKLRPDISNRDKPKSSISQVLPAFDPAVMRALKDESRGKGSAPAPITVSKDSVVLHMADANLQGQAQLESDAFAARGKAVTFTTPSDTSVQATPSAFADLEFSAPPGRYKLWLRGKSKKGTKHGSVWLQFDEEIGTATTRYAKGFGQFREVYPTNAFGWASATPLDKPETITLAGNGKHRLRVSGREGPVVLDQVVLSKEWVENPAQTGAAQ